MALWPPPAPQNRDVSPHGWGPGLLGHAPVCQESLAATCVFMEPVRGSGKERMVAVLSPVRHSVDQQ